MRTAILILILLLCTSPAFADYQSTILADSPVGYWRLGESSGTTATDLGSGGNNGTYTPNSGGAWTGGTLGATGALTGDANTAATFNGTSGYVTVGSNFGITGFPFTLECWVNRTSGDPVTAVSFAKNGASDTYYLLETRSGAWTITARNTTAQNYVSAATATAGTWFHIVGVFNSNTSKEIFVNGVSKGSLTTSVTFGSPSTLLIGKVRTTDAAGILSGSVDEVAIYNTALNSTQIAAHYAAGTGTGGGSIPVIIHHMRSQGFALFNGSPWQLRWEVECVPPGVLFYGSSGEFGPLTGRVVGEWSGELGDIPPDAMLGVKRRYYATREQLIQFVACFTGPGIPYPSHGSPAFDFDADGDGDVDQSDFGVWQRMLKL